MTDKIPTLEELDLPRLHVKALRVSCHNCHHRSVLPLAKVNLKLNIKQVEARLKCSKCGMVGKSNAQPDWPNQTPNIRTLPG